MREWHQSFRVGELLACTIYLEGYLNANGQKEVACQIFSYWVNSMNCRTRCTRLLLVASWRILGMSVSMLAMMLWPLYGLMLCIMWYMVLSSSIGYREKLRQGSTTFYKGFVAMKIALVRVHGCNTRDLWRSCPRCRHRSTIITCCPHAKICVKNATWAKARLLDCMSVDQMRRVAE